ncbi:hypothetical protein IJ750_02240 [bacterium]|nr:hypothetical protein [bacterium]
MNKVFLTFIMFLFSFMQVNALSYNYSSTKSVPIKLKIVKEIDSESEIYEGQKINFITISDVQYNGKLVVARGEIIPAKIETIVTSGMNGFPAEIIVDEFEIPGIKSSQLVGTSVKKGQNRALWVYPLKWALTPIPFVGSLTNLIMGGHAKINSTDIFTVYYYPEWK